MSAELDEAREQIAQLQNQLANAHPRMAGELHDVKQRNHELTGRLQDARLHLVELERDKAESERKLRTAAESLANERDELLAQLEGATPPQANIDLEALRARCSELETELASVKAERDDYAATLDEFIKDHKRWQEKALTPERRDRLLAALGVGKQSPQYKRVKAAIDQMMS